MKLMLAVAVAILLLFCAAPAGAATPTKPERQMLTLVNNVRVKHNLCRLKVQPTLQRAAVAHSKDMATHLYFDHRNFAARMLPYTRGYSSWAVGENIACGTHASVLALYHSWWKSPEHRRNMLGNFKDVGVGRACGYGIVFFTMDFGRRS